ncbi:MAG: patatin-like phospholipase family protein [Clostridia bacterium]|nr:patatin-like phospholipase family protein [Clostridia bacterium]
MFEFFKRLFGIKKREIKLGLALGSGGAKGFAELGALKAFEENGVEFDVVGGTSIGSIIGAFYADGYSTTDMMELMGKIDFSSLSSLFMINMDTSSIFDVIDRTIGSKNIEELKKPFLAIATEIESGEEEVFKSGRAALSLCASASYPPIFKPVVIGEKRYVDGAFSNSVPADRVKELGADYVVGIDLSNHEKKQGILSRIFPTYQGKVDKPWEKGYEFSDVYIHPDLTEFSPIQIREGEKMFEIGYKAAMEKMPKILSDISKLKTNDKKKRWKKSS